MTENRPFALPLDMIIQLHTPVFSTGETDAWHARHWERRWARMQQHAVAVSWQWYMQHFGSGEQLYLFGQRTKAGEWGTFYLVPTSLLPYITTHHVLGVDAVAVHGIAGPRGKTFFTPVPAGDLQEVRHWLQRGASNLPMLGQAGMLNRNDVLQQTVAGPTPLFVHAYTDLPASLRP